MRPSVDKGGARLHAWCMQDLDRDFELVGGMIAAEAPQSAAARVIEMLERGEADEVRELIEARAVRTANAIALELSAVE